MQKNLQKIVVMGLGYIGLPTASMLATKGHKVMGVDINPNIVKTINQGNIHIVEPDLDILVKSAVGCGNLRASLVPEEADTFILAVPTPFMATKRNPKTPTLVMLKQPPAPLLRFSVRETSSFLNPHHLLERQSGSMK